MDKLAQRDPVQVFLTYMQFAGNVEQTAAVLDLDTSSVKALEVAGNWKGKIEELVRLSEGKEPGEFKIAINRGVNFIQADRLRRLLDRVLTSLSNMPDEELIGLLTTTGPKGASFSTRPLTDLTKAAAEAQAMTRLALGDVGAGTLAEEDSKGSDIALSVMKAMNGAAELSVPVDVPKMLP